MKYEGEIMTHDSSLDPCYPEKWGPHQDCRKYSFGLPHGTGTAFFPPDHKLADYKLWSNQWERGEPLTGHVTLADGR
eukprot:4926069-Prymnesium_polylepis.1